jgi:UDP-N-acetylglucosamine 2-epimerase (non-hydrolysing)
MAPLILELTGRGSFALRVISTGQHTDMLRQALGFFSISPDVDLAVMKERQGLDHITASVLTGVGKLLDEDAPDAVLVHGDTSTTFASSLAAFYRHIPVGHVEAGLRSFDMDLPFPEEMNRVLTDRLSRWLFAPTPLASENLKKEAGSSQDRIFVTGNTVIDALFAALEAVNREGADINGPAEDAPLILMTAHRRESWGEPMKNICRALLEILKRHGGYRALVPMHRNPAVRGDMISVLGGCERVRLCEPLDYPDFVRALGRCKIILSDSGGIQEEASALGKPVVVLRSVTERPEAVDRGTAVLAGSEEKTIVEIADRLLCDEDEYRRIERRKDGNPFGDGRASVRIADILTDVI